MTPVAAPVAPQVPGRRRAWLVWLAAAVTVAVTARMGIWQLDRARQKTELADRIAQRGAMPPLSTAELARDAETAVAQHQRRIQLSGTWMAGHSVFLDNRQMEGHPGFFLVTPLLLGPGDAVLVQRGWLPRDPVDRTRLPAVPTPEGPVQLIGRVVPPPSALLDLGAPGSGTIRQNLDLSAFAHEIGVPLRPLSVQQLDASVRRRPVDPAAEAPWRAWPVPVADVAKHHGYAAQWFAMSALALGLTVWFQVIQPRRRAARHP